MNRKNLWSSALVGVAMALSLAACGGGGSGSAASSASDGCVVVSIPSPTAAESKIATDGLNWINFRRGQLHMAALSTNPLVGAAAQAHSFYQKANKTVTHDETACKAGFTGETVKERLATAGYKLANGYAYGEIISATNNSSGEFMVEELITAIYHRFVMFDPMFKEIGTGAITTSAGYSYFTANLTATNGLGPELGKGVVFTWPMANQTNVTPNFFSDYESPDPVDNANEVGYPVSVHADNKAVLTVQDFSIRQRGGADLSVKLLQKSSDVHTSASTMAIIPLAVLKAATVYDVNFTGTADGIPVRKTWSFTTK